MGDIYKRDSRTNSVKKVACGVAKGYDSNDGETLDQGILRLKVCKETRTGLNYVEVKHTYWLLKKRKKNDWTEFRGTNCFI